MQCNSVFLCKFMSDWLSDSDGQLPPGEKQRARSKWMACHSTFLTWLTVWHPRSLSPFAIASLVQWSASYICTYVRGHKWFLLRVCHSATPTKEGWGAVVLVFIHAENIMTMLKSAIFPLFFFWQLQLQQLDVSSICISLMLSMIKLCL